MEKFVKPLEFTAYSKSIVVSRLPNTLVLKAVSINKSDYIKDFVLLPKTHFDVYKKDCWFENDFGRRIIRDIEQIPLTMPTVKASVAMYGISMKEISSGAKNLFLMLNTDFVGNASAMGPNCVDILLDIASSKVNGVSMAMLGYVSIPSKCFGDRKIFLEDFGEYVNSFEEYMYYVGLLESRGVWDD